MWLPPWRRVVGWSHIDVAVRRSLGLFHVKPKPAFV